MNIQQKNQQGQNLIEIIIAIGLFLIVAAGSMMILVRYLDTFTATAELTQVKYIAQQGFEAVQSISYNSWLSLADGTSGINNSSGEWQLQAEPNLIKEKYTRSIIIAPVQRDGNCDLIESGGTPDPDTKMITVNVNWNSAKGAKTKFFSKLYARWYDPTTCSAAGEAGSLEIDVSNARIDATQKSLIGVMLHNNGTVPITIDKMTLTWTKPGEITYIKINTTNYWHATNGIGTPQGAQPSGTELDIVNFGLDAGQSYDVDAFRFNEKVDSSTFTITATMNDGSSVTEVTTPPFVP